MRKGCTRCTCGHTRPVRPPACSIQLTMFDLSIRLPCTIRRAIRQNNRLYWLYRRPTAGRRPCPMYACTKDKNNNRTRAPTCTELKSRTDAEKIYLACTSKTGKNSKNENLSTFMSSCTSTDHVPKRGKIKITVPTMYRRCTDCAVPGRQSCTPGRPAQHAGMLMPRKRCGTGRCTNVQCTKITDLYRLYQSMYEKGRSTAKMYQDRRCKRCMA